MTEQGVTLGIEEEYLLVDRESRDLLSDPPPALFKACEQRLASQVTPEFLRAQIEVGTPVCRSLTEARQQLTHLRRSVCEVAEEHGAAIIAASTHPFAHWTRQRHTDKERYNTLARDIGAPARRLLICGMHVHVGIADDDLRIELANQVGYFLPHLLALSTSSPFWEGIDTGLMSYRLSVFDELPRTGLPERFESYGEYQRHVQMLVNAGIIEDATKIWWDVRPSARFPTLEMRISDMCTRLDDAMCVAALYVCVIAMLIRLRRANQRWRAYANMLVAENRWRAQRYGVDEGLIDFGRGRIVPYPELLGEIVDLIRPEAERLGCLSDVEHARTIVARGTSAHNQRRIHQQALAAGASEAEALAAVVDWLVSETRPKG
ncbi:MAG: carboxylate-amine ligase [Alphaproteobacteria bacterium]